MRCAQSPAINQAPCIFPAKQGTGAGDGVAGDSLHRHSPSASRPAHLGVVPPSAKLGRVSLSFGCGFLFGGWARALVEGAVFHDGQQKVGEIAFPRQANRFAEKLAGVLRRRFYGFEGRAVEQLDEVLHVARWCRSSSRRSRTRRLRGSSSRCRRPRAASAVPCRRSPPPRLMLS